MTEAESLFASFLARGRAGEDVELEELCRAHPAHGTELRELHRLWLRLEEIQCRAGLSGSLAERLGTMHGSNVDPRVELEQEGSGEFTQEIVGRLSGRRPSSGRYHLKGEVARGGMGAVLRVWDEDLRRHLAMKVMLGRGEPETKGGTPVVDERQLARFLEEAQVTGQLEHPGIVPVHELGLDADGQVFFTMKLVKGKTLGNVFDELAAGQGDWTQTRVLGLILKVCEAMSYAHARDVIHRDLKPANVMVGKFGEVYVMDWGLAKILGRDDAKDLRVRPQALTTVVLSDRRDHAELTPDSPLYTMDGDVVGTPAYMPPEQAAGRASDMGPASDVYALGAMLYHLLAGQMPYVPPGARVSPYALLMRVQEGAPRALSELAPAAPPELVAICEKAMERKADERYPDMQALAADLAAFVEGRVVQAHQTGAWAETRKWVQRNKALAGSLAAALVLLALGLVTAVILREEAQTNFELAEERRQESEANEKRARENEALAAEQARIAGDRADDLLRLSALQDLEDLLGDAASLWPPHPENIPGSRAWIERGQALVAELPRHEAKRAELRALALPRTAEQRREERASHPESARLAALQAELEAKRPHGVAAPGLAELESEVASLEARVNERRDWRFPPEHGAARWWNAQLTKLIEGLEALVDEDSGLLAAEAVSPEHGWSVARRLAFAVRLAAGFAPGGEYAERWEASLPAIRASYTDLELAPQMGLVPIGPDPASGLWEFWHLATGTEPTRDPDGKLALTDETGAVLVLIPGGTFGMGAQKQDPARRNYDPRAEGDEGPVHDVTLSPFFLSKFELTQRQWRRIAGRNPSYYQPSGDRARTPLHPVEQVSWTNCMAWLPRVGLALPSEAQWEFACRAGTDTPWWTGAKRESLLEQRAANLADQAAARAGATWAQIKEWPELDDGYAAHAPVGSHAANRFGLHEVHGNVWEWCLDGYDSGFYRRSPERDPLAPLASSSIRVMRGGSFFNPVAFARSAYRNDTTPSTAVSFLGVRPARVITE